MRRAILKGAGSIWIAATALSCSPEAFVLSTTGTPETMTVSPQDISIRVGDTITASALVVDLTGLPLTGVPISWSSGGSAASISEDGLVTALREGWALVTATLSAPPFLEAEALVTVSPVEAPDVALPGAGDPTTIDVSPSTVSILVGDGQLFTATVIDQNGTTLPDTFDILWNASNSDLVTMSAEGLAVAIAEGTSEIQAGVMGLIGTAQLTASAPAEQSGALFSDGFESGDLSFTENGFRWAGTNGRPGTRPSVQTDNARTGTHSLRFVFGPNDDTSDAWSEARFFVGQPLTEIWLEWYIYYPSGTEGLGSATYAHRSVGGPTNNKFLRLWGGTYSSGNKHGMSGRPGLNSITRLFGEWKPNGTDMSFHPNLGTPSAELIGASDLGQWHRFRWHSAMATSGSAEDGVMELWWDDSKVGSSMRLDIFDTNQNFVDAGYLLGWANSGFSSLTYIWIDDFRVFTSNPGW